MRNRLSFSLCIVVAILVGSYGQELSQDKVIYTAQGPIRGYKSPNHDVFEYFGIPYATEPQGVDKFKAPLPPPTWTDIFNATDKSILCPQPFVQIVPGTNCLTANVHVPDVQNTENCTNCEQLPVLVIFQGIGYSGNSGNRPSSPNVLVNSQKIIAVTFNYRLNILGFLCLGTEVAPGNAGMKDQVALLRWVQENIASFGGDPNKITIAGCSAGGSSVDTLMLSNTADGLFHQIISESGCSLSPFAIQMDPVKNAFDHAVSLLNYEGTNDKDALGEFYASLSVETLANSVWLLLNDGNAGYFKFQPCVEDDLGQERFLSEAPIDILRKGSYKKLPTLYGYTDKEGIMRLPFLPAWSYFMNTAFWDFLPVDLEFENEEQRNLVASTVSQQYFTGAVTSLSELEFITYFTDVMFVNSILRVVTYQIEAGNDQVYLYEYGFVHSNSASLSVDDVNAGQGATHCEQLSTAFGEFPDGGTPSEEFLDMAAKMGEIYLNFITTGNPTPNVTGWPAWSPVNSQGTRTPYYLITNTTEVVNANNNRPISARMAFWDQIYQDNQIRVPLSPSQSYNASFSHFMSKNTWLAYAIVVIMCFK